MESNGVLLNIFLKYLFEGLAVGLAAKLVGKGKLKMQEVATLGLTAAVVLLLLDVYAPSVGSSTRTGAGFGIGANAVGGLSMVEGMHNGDKSDKAEGMCNNDKGDKMVETFAPLHGHIGDYYSEYKLNPEMGEYLYNMDELDKMDKNDKYAAIHQLDISFRPQQPPQCIKMKHQRNNRSARLRHGLEKRYKGIPVNKLVKFAPTYP